MKQPRGSGLTGTQELILDALCEMDTALTSEIAEATGLTNRTVGGIMPTFAHQGYVERVTTRRVRKDSLWRITDLGRRVAVMPNPDVWEVS